MNNILVLTDFSPSAEYAASYACTLAKQLNSTTIVLFNSFKVPMAIPEALQLITDEEAIHQVAMERLKDLKEKLGEILPAGVSVKYRADRIPLEEINSIVESEEAGLIVMGTSTRSGMEEAIMGSHVISVCKATSQPVILVPEQVGLQPLTQIALACDMKEVKKTIPFIELKKVLDEFNLPLSILHLDEKEENNNMVNSQQLILDEMLGNYNPTYNNIHSANKLEGMISFEKLHPQTLIILIFKRHNLMEGLFYNSLTRQLAHRTPFPLLILREGPQ